MDVEPVSEQKEALTAADIAFLNSKMAKQLRAWTVMAAVSTIVLLLWQAPTLTYVALAFATWALVSTAMWLLLKRTIDKGVKLVTRGEISARFRQRDEGSRNKSSDGAFVLQVNGKLIVVNQTMYEKYFKRDVAEFHYLADGLILHDQLLRRGDQKKAVSR